MYIVPESFVEKVENRAGNVGKNYNPSRSIVAVGNCEDNNSVGNKNNKAVSNRFY